MTASRAAMNGQSLSRKDDLESLVYSFMCIINPDLVPWK